MTDVSETPQQRVDKIVDRAPPLSAGQIEQLRGLLPAPSAQQRFEQYRRLTTRGQRIDGSGVCTLLVIHEADGLWTIRVGDAPDAGVTLTRLDMVALCETILARAR